MYLYRVLIVLIFICLTGCSWFGGNKVSRDFSADQLMRSVDFGRILNKDAFKKGGRIAFDVFQAGDGVEANEELDKIGLMMADGFADVIKDRSGKFKIAESYDDADFIVDGYIVEKTKPGKMERWMPGKDVVTLAVEGEIRTTKDGQLVAVFRHRKAESGEKISHRVLGRNIGREVANFLVYEMK